MAKLKLTHAELAALDALIAEMQGDHKGVEAEIGDVKAFITAVVRVTAQATKVVVKATPYVTDIVEVATAVLGRETHDEATKSLEQHAKAGINVQQLIELRKKFN
ncbi:hypothetical protein HDE69_002291 [Pedobacter cryoconitis]|uniref:Uncharacterized protein n=1 Tax=Pedobacter cryoconitis TaxID=188932 RepID=A0A7W8YTC8_9SPHI|nr:hypothetical protein [Pedobacter cryoconitis]MBB5621238.1 hypothetical protein [Pedobacter cryoconitis]MBB5645451.1 hypothetical protein [Pedobacter cryoconitis]